MNWWKLAYSTAVLTGIFAADNSRCQVAAAFFAESQSFRGHSRCISASIAFINPSENCSTRVSSGSNGRSTALLVGSTGWDNDNFLDALSKGSDALEKANEEYRNQSRFANMRPASADDGDIDMIDDLGVSSGILESSRAVNDDTNEVKDVELSKEQIERIKRQNEEESGSGEMFKKMLERAQQGATLKASVQPPPPTPPIATQSSVPALPEGFEKLSVEAQAALFRQLMASPQPEQWPAAPGPRPEAKGQAMVAADGRKIGRNKDADSLVNTSDVYFAQLKLDSAVRNQARRAGDMEKAEAVFADPTIPEIKLHINPYMEEQRKKELEMIETAADEMFTPEILQDLRKEVNVKDRGVSYKEMLEQRKKAALKQQSGSLLNAQPLPTTPPRPMEPPTVKSPVIASVPAPSTPSLGATGTMTTEDETRRDIRTLMGLLIKHRGGPGFGAGRIVGPEMERFASLSSEVVSLLQNEVRSMPQVKSSISQSASAASLPSLSQNVAKTQVSGAITPSTVAPVEDRMNGVLACIEGAITMYKNSPPELQQSVLLTLRAALFSALSVCNTFLGLTEEEQPPALRSQGGNRMPSVLACIEGAITMYKNSPPELQQSVLATLRAAILSAMNACDEVIATAEIQQYEGFRTTSTDPRTRNGSPAQYDDVTPEFSDGKLMSPSPSFVQASQPMELDYRTDRSDENAAFLESVYEKLKRAAGDGKMGLRQDLTTTEAEELANDISRMRSMLVEELNGASIQRESSSQPPAAAQYKQMLAKVMADKDAAGNN
jgi:hypothetical protein